MKIQIGQEVKNPVENNDSDFLSELFESESATRKVRMIFEKDLTTEEQGYTKQVQSSDKPDSYVFLDGSVSKYRLSDIVAND